MGLGVIKSSKDVEQLALSVPDTGSSIGPAFAGLGAPALGSARARNHRRVNARQHGRAYCPRGSRGIALQVADVLDAMREDCGLPIAQSCESTEEPPPMIC